MDKLKEYVIIRNVNSILELKENNSFEIELDTYCVEDYIEIMNQIYNLDVLDSENSYVVAVDYYNKPLGVYHVSIGDYKHCDLYNRTIGVFLLLTGARKFFIIHNHPDNNYKQSQDDLTAMIIIKTMGQSFDIEFIGSFIVTETGWSEVVFQGENKLNIWEV